MKCSRVCGIRNYRVFDDLEISGLSRINLIGGKNNSGKTSLLEALFLLSGGGNAQMLMNTNVIRELASVPGSAQQAINTFWKPLFHDLDITRTVEIDGVYAPHGSLGLRISLERVMASEFPIAGTPALAGIASADLTNGHSLVLLHSGFGESRSEGRVILKAQGFEFQQPTLTIPFNATILTSRSGNVQEDAIRLGSQRQQKRGDLILEALQIIEPRLQSIEDNSVSGAPMIWGDVGLSELVPLSAMAKE